MAIDGRPDDVDKDFTSQQMPMISQNYKYFFSSRDPSKIDQIEIDKFKIFIDKAHKKHILVRLWASPDHEEMWKFLESQGVDFINTDDPAALSKYYLKGK
jgi:alkaline phosphatase